MNHLTRRQAISAFAGATLLRAAAPSESRLSLEGYIWQNLAALQRKPLADLLDGFFEATPKAGFRNIELNHGFFTPALRDRVLGLTRKHSLRMPSVYVGGGMHEEAQAQKTIASALEIGAICKEFGCTAIVNNPDPKPANALKTDAELALQAKLLDQMGQTLSEKGLQLRVHHHAPEMVENVREWRHILNHTDPKYVSMCIDLEHAQRTGVDPEILIREAGKRAVEIHVRNKKKDIYTEAFGDGDIDHVKIAQLLTCLKLKPLVVVELVYHNDTEITRDFTENLRLSRIYAEKTFGL